MTRLTTCPGCAYPRADLSVPCPRCGSRKRNGSTRRWRNTRATVLANGALLCWICNEPGADTIDHIVPLARGGTDDYTNLAPAHELCNKRKGDR